MADSQKAGASSSSFSDGLKKILGQIAQLSVLPDADPQLVQGLQQVITMYVKQKASQMASPQGGPPGGGPQQGPPGLSPTGGGMGGGVQPAGLTPGGGNDVAPPSPMSIGPGGGAGMSGFGMPNPDELRRVLAGPGGPGGAV